MKHQSLPRDEERTNKKELKHSECGGELLLLNKKKVEAGWPRGKFFYLYQCKKCGKILPVGG